MINYNVEDEEDIVPNPDTAIEYQDRDIGGEDGGQELDWKEEFFTRNVFQESFQNQQVLQRFKKVDML